MKNNQTPKPIITSENNEQKKVVAPSLNGVLAGPLSSRGLVSGAVGLVDVGNLGHEGVVGVRVGQH